MAVLSEETSRDLKMEVLDVVSGYLKEQTKPKPRLLGLVTRVQLQDELDISLTTIKRWEDTGLKQYKPPLEDSRTIFYKVDDILKFLGVDA
ncbi:hypothetical protein SAG0027_03895 [Streptococcus agalactiae FSL S3-251]|uniref:hypothetical protein n=1 Tax=Streptococcus TaxID=1301 RepID=UPI0002F12706|nr:MULTISPECIES: hypothetical protein [Streptococcus]EPV90438.1 hypothetical protein SAG0027_03895 [Streptococcus agalactiae FSL S3-251]WFM79653.1 hypothetical protein P7F70_09080 [Streptococcus pluranimalium]